MNIAIIYIKFLMGLICVAFVGLVLGKFLGSYFEDFIKHVNIELRNTLPKSPLGKALEYS
ncbi:MAG: hypothetical protein K0R54_6111 [Clostridiaceae bacterium]|jgi:hypothetical protein|nr:hypothetical protein [Clostridiaceae bacterium]